MMRILFVIGLALTCLNSTGQIVDNTYKTDGSNIYNQSFIQYFKYLEKENYSKHDTIFIEEDFKLTDNLLGKIGNTRLVVVKESELKEMVIKRSGLTLYRLFPLEYKNEEFYVSFVPFGVTYNTRIKNELSFCNSGSYWVIFNFENGRFNYKRIRNNAI